MPGGTIIMCYYIYKTKELSVVSFGKLQVCWKCHILVVTWALMILPDKYALSPLQAYILGKSPVPTLQLICISGSPIVF